MAGWTFNYLCPVMIRKITYTLSILLLVAAGVFAQVREPGRNNFGSGSGGNRDPLGETDEEDELEQEEKHILSIIRTWKLKDYGAKVDSFEVDTALSFFHVYHPISKRSISNTYTGNYGGAYLSNDYFERTNFSDFYFYNSFDAYATMPENIQYFNTTTPYTLLDYSQSENKNVQTESRFNVFHSQNVNKDFNFTFFYNQGKSTGHYRRQENKNSAIGLYSSYTGEKLLTHGSLIFNGVDTQENGGLQPNQDLNDYDETETYLVNLLEAESEIRNSTFSLSNEYRVGTYVEGDGEEDEEGNVPEIFIPRTGFIHQFEYSGNRRIYNDPGLVNNQDFYPSIYLDSLITGDTIKFNRLTNIFQIRFYEAPDRKYTFGKRAFIGHDRISISMPETDTTFVKENRTNTFVGGGVFRDEGKFWQWGGDGKLYLTGYRSGQTELSAYLNKPLKIGKDTMSFRVEGELNTIVPDYFQQTYKSNHYNWDNRFDNINEMIIRSTISSKRYKLTLGMNYALIGNYIYTNSEALPQQGGSEMLVISAYLKKDFETKYWLIRTQLNWQKANQDSYLHLPDVMAYTSVNFKTAIFKVMKANLGVDFWYNTSFYADAYDPATGRFYWQDKEKIGDYPYFDVHANIKLKRTRVFFQWLNAGQGLFDGNFWGAPSHPLYRRTFRLGVAWSFYD